MTPPRPQTRVFISYNHNPFAAECLGRLKTHLSFYADREDLSIFSDQNIKSGEEWDRRIRAALSTAEAAILLVDADFLASSYIRTVELPAILEAANRGRLVPFSVILMPCAFERSGLDRFQACNPPSRPLIRMGKGRREEVWKRVADQVIEHLGTTSPSSTAGAPIKLWSQTPTEFAKTIGEMLASVYGRSVIEQPQIPARYGRGDFAIVNPDPVWGGKAIVEIKHHRPENPVGMPVLRQLAEYVRLYNGTSGIVVTTSDFTAEGVTSRRIMESD